MKEIRTPMKYKKLFLALTISIASIAVAVLSLPTDTVHTPATAAGRQDSVGLASVANPTPPSDMCQNLQVLVLLDRSGSVVNEGSAVVQKYKDQVKKVWHTLHNISATYGGYASGYLWAFAGRTSDQMPRLLAKDNNKDGVVNEGDRDLRNPDVLAGYDTMTQDIYFKSDSGPMYPSNQTAAYGYNPKNEDTKYYTKPQYTNWHNAFLMAQETISVANATDNAARDYSMVIIVTDGEPTVDDGPNHKWDLFAKNKKIDENFDGNANTTSHATRTKAVVDALREGKKVGSSTQSFAPVQVHGVLIGGGKAGATRMNNTYGSGNWFQSSTFDSTLGAQLLQIVAATCPPEPSLESGMEATIVEAPSTVIEDSDVTYVVDITNTGSALLDDVYVSNGSVVDLPADSTYTSSGYLSPGKKRRFSVTLHIGGGATATNVSIPYSAQVAEDPSLMAPGAQMSISGSLNAGLAIQLVPRPS